MKNLSEVTETLQSQINGILLEEQKKLNVLVNTLNTSRNSAFDTMNRDIQGAIAEQTERYKGYLFQLCKTLIIPTLLSIGLILMASLCFFAMTHYAQRTIALQVQKDELEMSVQLLQHQYRQLQLNIQNQRGKGR